MYARALASRFQIHTVGVVSGERDPDKDDVRRGQRLAELREAAGFRRQQDLATTAGLLPPDVSRIETGRSRFTGETMMKGYAHAFGLTLEELGQYRDGALSLEDMRARWAPKPVPTAPAAMRGSAAIPARQIVDATPNRAAAIVLLRSKGYPEEVLEALRMISFKGAEDFTVQDYVTKAKEVLLVLEGIEPVVPAVPPLPHEDPEAPPTEEEIIAQAALLPKRRKRAP